ncbi:MAG: hypothetical protein LBQ60_02620 [Bacteroidales bacterium]|jgi:hypothetical protein|nr:hypothetical protein [Bacteroidales bacterium]
MNTGTKAGLVIWGILTVVLLYAAFTNKTIKSAKEEPVTHLSGKYHDFVDSYIINAIDLIRFVF